MMQSSLREENLFWAGILLHGNRLEIATRMESKAAAGKSLTAAWLEVGVSEEHKLCQD